MTKLEEAVILAARSMTRDARVTLYELLMIDLDDAEQKEVDEAWAKEIQRRLDDANGPSLDSDEVVARIRRRVDSKDR